MVFISPSLLYAIPVLPPPSHLMRRRTYNYLYLPSSLTRYQGRGWPWLPSSFLPSLFSHYVLYQQSPPPSICCCCLLFLPTLSRPLLTQSSHRILGVPRLLFLHFLCVWSVWQFFISHPFHRTCLFQYNPHQFLLKTFLHSNPHVKCVRK